jgi:hypothetical protein
VPLKTIKFSGVLRSDVPVRRKVEFKTFAPILIGGQKTALKTAFNGNFAEAALKTDIYLLYCSLKRADTQNTINMT